MRTRSTTSPLRAAILGRVQWGKEPKAVVLDVPGSQGAAAKTGTQARTNGQTHARTHAHADSRFDIDRIVFKPPEVISNQVQAVRAPIRTFAAVLGVARMRACVCARACYTLRHGVEAEAAILYVHASPPFAPLDLRV